jgi:hypothetical protein
LAILVLIAAANWIDEGSVSARVRAMFHSPMWIDAR